MSDEIQLNEIDVLKSQADLMGISYHPSIGVDKLREKIKEAQDSTKTAEASSPVVAPNDRAKAKERALKLVRIRLSCMDPTKNNHPGEIITVSNDVVGTVKRYVPYDEAFYENGYHVEQIIYNFLRDRQYAARKVQKTPKGDIVNTVLARAYNIEVLPQLTEKELANLKNQQLAANAID